MQLVLYQNQDDTAYIYASEADILNRALFDR